MPAQKIADVLSHSAISAVEVIDALIEHAHAEGASDIHIDPGTSDLRIRLRVDGVLHEEESRLPKRVHAEIISRIKILAGMRTDEHQAMQDGRFRHVSSSGDALDVRVSIAPTYHGENAVLRLLSDHASNYTLEALGFGGANLEKLLAALGRPHGMLLATGPTGSGKTTTLYTLMKMLNAPEVSIVTIEDPIEYAVEQVEQIQVAPRAGLTFASGLRSVLRQDPNIIMVGEIRDSETAAIAVNTALTGHLLLSTLHTSDAATTLPRLLDMGVDAYLIASTVNLAIGQRLVRKICPACKKETEVTDAARKTLEASVSAGFFPADAKAYRGEGCDACGKSGYAGRLCISEVMVVEANIRDAIMRKAPSAELRALARQGGMATMLEDGFSKVREGQTTIEEVLRVVHE